MRLEPQTMMLSSLLAAQLALSPLPAIADGGAEVFQLKCVACHELGGNAINPSKSLKSSSLEANGYASQDAIIQLITNGKGQMPSYGPKSPPFARLTDAQIDDVASYVRSQAAAGWPTQ